MILLIVNLDMSKLISPTWLTSQIDECHNLTFLIKKFNKTNHVFLLWWLLESKGGNFIIFILRAHELHKKSLRHVDNLWTMINMNLSHGRWYKTNLNWTRKKNAFGEGSLTTYLPFGSMSYGICKSPNIKEEMD